MLLLVGPSTMVHKLDIVRPFVGPGMEWSFDFGWSKEESPSAKPKQSDAMSIYK